MRRQITLAIVKGERQGLYLNGVLAADGRKLSGKQVVKLLAKAGMIDGTVLGCDSGDLAARRFPESLQDIEVSDE